MSDPSIVDGPIRTAIRDVSLAAIDWNCPSLKARDLALLERFEHELRVRAELGMEAEACGLAAAMLIVWHTATTTDICLEPTIAALISSPTQG